MSPASSRRAAGAVGLLLAAAAAVRFRHLGARSLWTDEASTWTASSGSLAELLRFCATEDASPPLHYLLTSLALTAGDTEAHLRLVSALASLAMVWLTYRLARLHAGRAESSLAAALVAFSAYQVMYAQEARTYALVAAWMLLATLMLARATGGAGSRYWRFYAIALAGAFYTQTIGWLIAGAHGAFVLAHPGARRHWRGFALGLLGGAALYVPWVIVSLEQAGHLPQSHWYVPSPDAHGSFLVLRAILVAPLSLVAAAGDVPGLAAWMPARLAHVAVAAAPLVPLAAALFALGAAGPRARVAWLAAACLVLPLAAVFVVSLSSSLWLSRYFVFTTPFLAVLIAHGVVRLRPAPLRAGWAGLLLALAAFALWRYDTSWTKEPWREVARTIAAQSGGAPRAARVAVLVPFDADAVRYYFRDLADAPAVFEVSHADDPFASHFTPAQLDDVAREAAARTAGFDEVWVVVRSANSDSRRAVADRTEAVAAAGRAALERTVWDSSLGPVRAARFARTPDAAP